MKLNDTDYKRFLELQKLIKSKKATAAEKAEFDELSAKKNEKGSNDPKWWMNYPDLANGAANIPWNVIPGTAVNLKIPTGQAHQTDLGSVVIASIAPAIGKSTSESDAFNTQVRQLWLDMHRKYRGIGTYEKSDLGIALIAISQAFSLIAKFERIYGVVNYFKMNNRVMPYGLTEALCIDKDLGYHLADFRYTLNYFINKLQQLCLPKGLDVITSDIVLLSNVFKDAKSDRAGLFAFDTSCYGVYNDTRFTSGGCVDFIYFGSVMHGATPANNNAWDLGSIQAVLHQVVDGLLADDDIARMCSDMIAAYGVENVQTLVSIPTDYVVVPVEDYERQVQLHNATAVGTVFGTYSKSLEVAVGTPITAAYCNTMWNTNDIQYCIYQLNNVIYCEFNSALTQEDSYYDQSNKIQMGTDPSAAANAAIKTHDVLLDMWVDKPSVDDILVATRFTVLGDNPLRPTGKYFQPLACFGTQIVEEFKIHYYNASSQAYTANSVQVNLVTASGFGLYAELLLNQIDWRPLTYIIDANEFYVSGDLDNFTIVNSDTLNRIHEVCVLSGYKMPMINSSK